MNKEIMFDYYRYVPQTMAMHFNSKITPTLKFSLENQFMHISYE